MLVSGHGKFSGIDERGSLTAIGLSGTAYPYYTHKPAEAIAPNSGAVSIDEWCVAFKLLYRVSRLW
jgi:hypothetical protein